MKNSKPHQTPEYSDIVLAVHGGAGTLGRKNMTAALEARYRKGLERALKAGYKVLARGGSALDAVEAAVKVLEDSPLFNAGRGAVFTSEGKIEHDATIMDGRTKAAGGVTAVTVIKNPVSAARAVMEKTRHILLAGKGAERFAKNCGLPIVDPSYFWTKRRWQQLEQARAREKKLANEKKLDHSMTKRLEQASKQRSANNNDGRFGTVGAVALDRNGNLAVATSTGGLTNKMPGRIGDSALIGAGTYADNATCAVSTTGHGESFMRQVVAYDIGARMKYTRCSLAQAAEDVIMGTFQQAGGEGGAIALDAAGNCVMPFNSEGMYRGCITRTGETNVSIFAS